MANIVGAKIQFREAVTEEDILRDGINRGDSFRALMYAGYVYEKEGQAFYPKEQVIANSASLKMELEEQKEEAINLRMKLDNVQKLDEFREGKVRKGGLHHEPKTPRPNVRVVGQGYQPTKSTLDSSNPPRGKSGVPGVSNVVLQYCKVHRTIVPRADRLICCTIESMVWLDAARYLERAEPSNRQVHIDEFYSRSQDSRMRRIK